MRTARVLIYGVMLEVRQNYDRKTAYFRADLLLRLGVMRSCAGDNFSLLLDLAK